MSATIWPAAQLHLAELPEGGTVELVPIGHAVEELSRASRCTQGDAARRLADDIEAERVEIFALRGANAYAVLATEATVWLAGVAARPAQPSHAAPRGFLRHAAPSSPAWGSPAAVVRKGPAPADLPAFAGRPAVTGRAGLSALLRAAADRPQPAAALAGLPAGVRLDQEGALQRISRASTSTPPAGRSALKIPGQRFVGFAEADDGAAQRLVLVQDLEAALSRDRPRARARQAMLDRLHSDTAPLFVATSDSEDYAPVVAEATRWREALPAGVESWRREKAAAASAAVVIVGLYMDRLPGAEALLRGLPLDRDAPEWAAELSERDWKALPALPPLDGRAGAIEAYRLCTVPGAERAAPELVRQVCALAITEHDAARLCPELAAEGRSFWEGAPEPVRAAPGRVANISQPAVPPPLAMASAAAPMCVVQPEGGAWPHKTGEWTDAERVAAFLMRHKHKVGDDELARIVGVSRQAINAQIGGSHRVVSRAKSPTWPDAWRPSVELLKECGLPLQPLQAVAAGAV